MPPQSDGTRGFWFGGFFHTLGAWERHRFNGGAVAVCFEGCCGGMCWPVDRPATHAAAGAAARGALIFCFGGFFHTLGSGWHERVRGGGFNPLRGATTGVVMRRRATSGEMARGGLVFVFSLEVAPVSEGDSFTRSGVVRHACRLRRDGTRRFWFGGFFHTPGSGRHERVRGGGFNPLRGATTGVVMRRRATSGEMARGGLVFVFSLEVAPVSEGDSFTRSGVVRHACRLRRDGTRRFWFRGFFHTPGSGRHPALRRGRRGGLGFVFCFGGFFHTLGSDRTRGGCC